MYFRPELPLPSDILAHIRMRISCLTSSDQLPHTGGVTGKLCAKLSCGCCAITRLRCSISRLNNATSKMQVNLGAAFMSI
jgi:hypothetical protein